MQHKPSFLIRWALVLCLSSFASVALAEPKIAVVDVRAALFASKAAQSFSKELEEEFKADEDDVRNIGNQAAKLQERLQTDGAIMSDSERNKLTEDLEAKAQEFNFLKNRFESAVSKRKQAFLQESRPRVDRALGEIVDAEQYELIIPREAALYVDAKYDITAKLIEKLDKLP